MEEQRPQKVRYNKAGTSMIRQDNALEDKMKHNKLRTGETCSNKTTGHVTKHAKTNGRLVLGGEMRSTQHKKDGILVKITCLFEFPITVLKHKYFVPKQNMSAPETDYLF